MPEPTVGHARVLKSSAEFVNLQSQQIACDGKETGRGDYGPVLSNISRATDSRSAPKSAEVPAFDWRRGSRPVRLFKAGEQARTGEAHEESAVLFLADVKDRFRFIEALQAAPWPL